jgi:hypothetical protein
MAMKQKNSWSTWHSAVGLVLSAAMGSVLAQEDPTKICASVPTIFTEKTVSSANSGATSMKKMLCSANWSSAQDAVNLGFDITVPMYDVPVPFSANFSRDKQEAWQSKNCSAEERSSEFKAVGYSLAREINPVSANAWLQCVIATTPQVPRALSCRITETETSAIFEVKWRPSEGMKDTEAPIVKSLDVMNTTCVNAGALKEGTQIGTGGTAILCAGNVDATPVLVVNTDRGSCLANGALATRVTTLAGKIILASPAVYRGDNLKLGSDLLIVTNGYDLTLDAKRLVLEGSPQIVAFMEGQKQEGVRGVSAGKIHVRARSITGDQLRVINFGQEGGPGLKGRTGDQGAKGGPAARRHWVDLKGCVGGHKGGTGGKGQTGGTGSAGASGGSGGDVVIEVEQGLNNGSIPRILVATQQTDRHLNPIACNGTCGGLGGLGGAPGDGGPGGVGGDGAGGDGGCGGHPGGGGGPQGDPGQQGPEGPLGGSGAIKLL